LDRERHREEQARLETDYLRGAIGAEEYERRQASLSDVAALRPEAVAYAGWWRRAAATLLDGLVLLVLWIVVFTWAGTTEEPTTGEISDAAAIAVLLALFLFPILYGWLMVGRWGQTLGKMALGEKVVRGADGGPVGYARAFGRLASTWLLGIFVVPLLVAYLWPIWDERKQTLYDKLVDTVVVKTR
jgi:uncharacterized RDD family membrane protein YckC